MTSLLEGAKRLVTRSSDLGTRITALEEVVEYGRGRLDDGLLDGVEGVVSRAGQRLRLSAEHTVVAIAGATGSGKSSTFNSLTGLDLAAVGVRRPTTSWTTACVWGREGADELLDWLEIPARHRVVRDSVLTTGHEDAQMKGVVLLDLPDHDSTEVSHHLEVDRLVALADLLVWVLDPQKYADAAIHERYLAPLKRHHGVMLVVLNHLDTVAEDRRQAMLDDVRRLLVADGLPDVPVLGISAREGLGMTELRAEIVRRVTEKKAARRRLEGDMRAAADAVAEASGTAEAGSMSKQRVAALEDALAGAAGVPTVVAAVEKSTRMRAGRATGWPLVSWVGRLKPDPLRRLHLDLGDAGKELTGRARTSVPVATPVQRARVDTEVRAVADAVSSGLTRPWADAVRRASVAKLDDLGDALDKAIGQTDLGVGRLPVWAGIVRVLQWLLICCALVGLVWFGFNLFAVGMGVARLEVADVAGLPLPLLLLVVGVGGGILLAMLCRVLVGATARRRAAAADKRLRDAISGVARELVVTPVQAELAAYDKVRQGLLTARR